VTKRLREALRTAEDSFGEQEELIESLVEPVLTVAMGSMTVEELHTFFRDRPNLEHVVVVDGMRPHGLVTREHLAAKLSGRYDYALPAKQAGRARCKDALTRRVERLQSDDARLARDGASGG